MIVFKVWDPNFENYNNNDQQSNRHGFLIKFSIII